MRTVEIIAVLFAIAYLWLAIRRNIWCWPAAIVSTLLSIWLLYESRLYMQSALQLFYAVMAVYGWRRWSRTGDGGAAQASAIKVWPLYVHVALLTATLPLSAALGWLLSHGDAAFPYWDSFTMIAALAATFMVAHKVLENWVYWFVIDGISVFLYAAQDLPVYAGLFVLYLVLVVHGFFAWRGDMQRQPALTAGA
jgi:nicotinamide mononucleotide transporter